MIVLPSMVIFYYNPITACITIIIIQMPFKTMDYKSISHYETVECPKLLACDWIVNFNLNTARNVINSTESKYLVMLSLFTWLSTCCSKAALRIIWLCHCSKSQESPLMLCHMSYSPYFYSFHGHICRKTSFSWSFLCPCCSPPRLHPTVNVTV